MYYFIFEILGLIIICLLLRLYYIWNLKLEDRYRIVEMADGSFIVQEINFFKWEMEGYTCNSLFFSLKEAEGRVNDIIKHIQFTKKSKTLVKVYKIGAGEINQNNTLLLKDLISQLSTAVNNNNKEEEELIFNEIEKVLNK